MRRALIITSFGAALSIAGFTGGAGAAWVLTDARSPASIARETVPSFAQSGLDLGNGPISAHATARHLVASPPPSTDHRAERKPFTSTAPIPSGSAHTEASPSASPAPLPPSASRLPTAVLTSPLARTSPPLESPPRLPPQPPQPPAPAGAKPPGVALVDALNGLNIPGIPHIIVR